MRWTRRLLIMVAGLIGGSVLAGCSGPDAPPSDAPPSAATATPTPGSQTPRVAAAVEVEDHVVDLTINSPAVGREVEARLLLPADFHEQPTRQWPVLYLLHGCCDTYEAWTRVNRYRATQPAVPDDHRDAGGWRGGLLLRLGHRAEMGDLPHC